MVIKILIEVFVPTKKELEDISNGDGFVRSHGSSFHECSHRENIHEWCPLHLSTSVSAAGVDFHCCREPVRDQQVLPSRGLGMDSTRGSCRVKGACRAGMKVKIMMPQHSGDDYPAQVSIVWTYWN